MTSTLPPARRRSSIVWIATAILLAVTLTWAALRVKTAAPRVSSSVLPGTPPPTAGTADQVRVFQTAFWRSPNAQDRILHAERREWLEKDGMKKWQWFLVVQPSPELMKYLRDDNAFGLAKATSAPAVEDAPDWFTFPPEAVEVLGSRAARLQLIFSKSENLLFATSSGEGFRPGAAAAPKPPAKLMVKGRLPNTSPPIPSDR